MRADEKLTAFVELKFAVSGSRRFASTSWRDFFETRRRLSGPESDEGHFSAKLLRLPRPAISESTGGAAADSFQVLMKNLVQFFYQPMAALNL